MSLLSPVRFRNVTTSEAVTADQGVTRKTLAIRALSLLSLQSLLGMCRYRENRRYRALIEIPVTVVTVVTEGSGIHLLALTDVCILATSTAGLAARVTQRVFMSVRYQGPPNSKTNPRPSYEPCRGSLFPCASRPHNPTACTSHNPLQHNETYRRHHLSADQREGVSARALSRPLTLLEGKTRTRGTEPGAERRAKRSTSEMTGNAGIDRQNTRVWVGWGQNLLGTLIIDVVSHYSTALSKILGGLGLEVGWPVKPAVLTQRACGIRQIAQPATRERPGAKTHQRPFFSHGGAYSHE
jgi:hypothetical protein